MEQFDFKRRFVLKGIGAAGLGVAVSACGGGGSNGGSSGSASGGSSGGKGVVPDPTNNSSGTASASCATGYTIPLYIDASVAATGIPADVPIFAYITGLVPFPGQSGATQNGTCYWYQNNTTNGQGGSTRRAQAMTMADNSQPSGVNNPNPVCGLSGVTSQSNYPDPWADYSIQLDRTCATLVADLADFNSLQDIGSGNGAFSGRIWFSVGTPKIPFTPNTTAVSPTTGATVVTQYATPTAVTGVGGYCLYDCLEFSWTPSTSLIYLDATQVDMFGFPVSYYMNGNQSSQQGVYNKKRSAIIQALAALPSPFNNNMPVPTTGVAAGTYPAAAYTGGYLRAFSAGQYLSLNNLTSNYFSSVISAAVNTWTNTPLAVTCSSNTTQPTYWGKAGALTSQGYTLNFYNNQACTGSPAFTFNDLSSNTIISCSGSMTTGTTDAKNTGKAILAGFNRGVITGSTTTLNIDVIGGTPPLYLQSAYTPPLSENYKVTTDNPWSFTFHQASSSTLAYGFAFDDVGEQSDTLQQSGTTSVNIQIGMFS